MIGLRSQRTVRPPPAAMRTWVVPAASASKRVPSGISSSGFAIKRRPSSDQEGCPTFGPDEKIHSCNQKQLGETVLFKA